MQPIPFFLLRRPEHIRVVPTTLLPAATGQPFLLTGDGAAAGVGSADGAAGDALWAAVGSSTASGAATGVGAIISAAVGSASGSGAATATGDAIWAAVGSSSGSSTALATGDDVSSAIGSAAGSAAASGVGGATILGAGSAAGTGSALATGDALWSSTGQAQGQAASAADPAAIWAAVGSCAASSTSVAVGIDGNQPQTVAADGTSSGVAQALAVGVNANPAAADSGGGLPWFRQARRTAAKPKAFEIPKLDTPDRVTAKIEAASAYSHSVSIAHAVGEAVSVLHYTPTVPQLEQVPFTAVPSKEVTAPASIAAAVVIEQDIGAVEEPQPLAPRLDATTFASALGSAHGTAAALGVSERVLQVEPLTPAQQLAPAPKAKAHAPVQLRIVPKPAQPQPTVVEAVAVTRGTSSVTACGEQSVDEAELAFILMLAAA